MRILIVLVLFVVLSTIPGSDSWRIPEQPPNPGLGNWRLPWMAPVTQLECSRDDYKCNYDEACIHGCNDNRDCHLVDKCCWSDCSRQCIKAELPGDLYSKKQKGT